MSTGLASHMPVLKSCLSACDNNIPV